MPLTSTKRRSRIAQAVFGLRTTAGATQLEMATRLGVSVATYARLEKNEEDGKFTPTWIALEELVKLSNERGLPKLAEVFAGEQRSRMRLLAKDLDADVFGYSGLAKQIPVEDFIILTDALDNVSSAWRKAK